MKFQCIKCNNIFDDSLIHGNIPRCRKCFPQSKSSIHVEVVNYIKSIFSEEIIENNKNILNNYELDLYLPSKKLAIELNGNYWHSELGGKRYKTYHLNKTNKCEKQEIKLIHIFEDEWIYKQEIIKNKLNHLLNINTIENIYARKCEIKEISSDESNLFLELYHIQGKDNSSIRLGLFYKEKLVSVMTFGKLRLALGYKSSKDGEYEMYRFCVGNKNVIGAGGKLLSYFIKSYKPSKIISYADRRWTSNNNAFYNKIGFIQKSITSPNYWYVNVKNYMHRIHRFNFRKQVLSKILEIFDPNLTEWENMQINEYDRIWDCGNLKYEWTKS